MTDISKSQYDSSGWSASLYNKTAHPVLELLAPVPGERIIDFGCGSGEVTLELMKLVGSEGLVVGVDASEHMIKQAKANGVDHASVVDIQASELAQFDGDDQKYDAVFSNAVLHWCKKSPRGVLQNAKRVLKPGGRIAVEMGGFLNCIGVRSTIHHVLRGRGYDPVALDPWFFPTVEEYRELLISEGFKPITIELVPRITPLPEGVYGWLATFFRSSFLQGFSDELAEEIMREVEDLCRVDCQDVFGAWSVMYMRLRYLAVLEQ
ncbi:S-adenosyl-L-methionine-dependent methyltransferase [Flagelloscypha sp. PMI_526]|nr:S-adenosyl-L-methionine-dependent methyltransferase [Flagelloscypha sp. PMI_526]